MKALYLQLKKCFFVFIFLIFSSGWVLSDSELIINDFVDIFQFDELKESSLNKGIKLKSYEIKQKLLMNDDINAIAQINSIYENNKLNYSFDLFPIDWNLIGDNNPNWKLDNTSIINTFIESNSNKNLAIRLSKPDFDNQIESLDNYDEVWIDYEPGESSNLCVMNTTLNFTGRTNSIDNKIEPEKESWVALYGGNNFRNLKFSANAEDSQYLKKDYKYLLSRILGFGGDNQWRLTKDDLTLVLQRQMNWPVTTRSSLIVNHSNLSRLKSVNILIKFKDELGIGKLLTIPIITSKQLSTSEYGVELDLAPHLEAAFPEIIIDSQNEPNSSQAYIQELFLHFYDEDAGKLHDIKCEDIIIGEVPYLPKGKKIQEIEQ